MKKEKSNLAASVTARLLNRARQTGDDYQALLTSFCFERFLYRLGVSSVRERFVLKGAMLLRLWSEHPYRATRDLDLLRRGDGSFDAIRTDIESICSTEVKPDALVFDPASIRMQAIRAEDEYAGTRVSLPARCAIARLSLQIDMGLGDSVWPPPQPCAYPALEGIIVLGDRNSRIKDFFDLHHLAGRFEFDRATLAEAMRRTFARRRTPVPAEAPIGLTPTYWENASRAPQVRAFARRAGLTVGPDPGDDILAALRPFLLPVLGDLRGAVATPGTWPPGGPWQSREQVER
jgi:hypothetical protein